MTDSFDLEAFDRRLARMRVCDFFREVAYSSVDKCFNLTPAVDVLLECAQAWSLAASKTRYIYTVDDLGL